MPKNTDIKGCENCDYKMSTLDKIGGQRHVICQLHNQKAKKLEGIPPRESVEKCDLIQQFKKKVRRAKEKNKK